MLYIKYFTYYYEFCRLRVPNCNVTKYSSNNMYEV